MMLSELFDEYAKWGAIHLSEDTREMFAYRSKLFLTAVGDKFISSVTAKDMDTLIKHCKDRDNKDTTINIAIRSIKACFGWAAHEEQGYLKENPFAKYKLLKVRKRAYQIIEGRDQVARLFEVVGDNKRYRIIMALYVYCGERRKEIWQLKWHDIKDDYVIFANRRNSEEVLHVLSWHH
jgi:integrase